MAICTWQTTDVVNKTCSYVRIAVIVSIAQGNAYREKYRIIHALVVAVTCYGWLPARGSDYNKSN